MRFSAKGNRFVAGRRDGRVMVFDVVSGQRIFEQSTDGMPVYLVEFLLDGNLIAFQSSHKTIQVWDVNNNQLVKEINSPKVFVSMAANAQGDLLATGGDEKVLQLWRMPDVTLELEKTFGESFRIGHLEFVPESELLLVQTTQPDSLATSLEFLDYQSEEISSSIKGITGLLWTNISLDGSRVVTATRDNLVTAWDIKSGKRCRFRNRNQFAHWFCILWAVHRPARDHRGERSR